MDSSISDSDTGNSDSGGAQEICAPLDAFSVNGTPPSEGDQVSVTLTGTVTRIEGDNAYVEPETVNDQPVMHEDMASEPNEEDLRQNAQTIDTQYP